LLNFCKKTNRSRFQLCPNGVKNQTRLDLKPLPIEVSVEIGWSPFLNKIAELVQMKAVNLITDTFEWCWLKPAQIGHISREYDLHYDVCHMMMEEEDNFIQ
jgi:hypothetical protein